MKKRKLIITSILVMSLIACAQIGKLVGGLLTKSSGDLTAVSMIAQHISNIPGPELGLTAEDYYPEGWKAGDNFVALTFLNRDGVGLVKVDGSLQANGADVPYVGIGSFVKITDASEQNIEIKTTSGQSASFNIQPQLPVKIKSINAGSNKIDRTKDLTIDLETPKGHEKTMIRVALMMDIAGVTDWAELGHYHSSSRITVLKEEFLNTIVPHSIAGGIREGESWLLIERYTMKTTPPKGIGAAQIRSVSFDSKKVTVSEEPDDIISGAYVYQDINDFKVEISKPNAYTGKPLSTARNFAIASFAVRATKLSQRRVETSSSTSYFGTGAYRYKQTTITTTTRTRAFPKLPKGKWDSLTEELYHDFVAKLKSVYNINLIPVERVLASKNYQYMFPIEEELTKSEYTSTYKGTKSLIPTSIGEIISSASSTFASDRPDARLVRELGVDGIISVTIDFEMPWFDDSEDLKLNPRMSFRITGGSFGYNYGPIVFAQGVISGEGKEVDGDNLTIDFLQKTIRKDKLMDAFAKGFKQLGLEEEKLGYKKIWKHRGF